MDTVARRALRLALVCVFAGAVQAAPTLQIDWSVNDGPVNHVLPDGTGAGGAFNFTGESIDPGTGLTLEFDLEGDAAGMLNGNVALANVLEESVQVSVLITMPVETSLPSNSELNAFVAAGLTTGAGGGALGSFPPWLWQTSLDGAVVGNTASLFYDPFLVTHGGAASSTSTADFGYPEPVDGPAVFDSIGFMLQFNVTDGDIASITSDLSVAGCHFDLDGDGLVAADDLIAMLSLWGPCAESGPCPGDLDGNGAVDVKDLLQLLGNWGACSS